MELPWVCNHKGPSFAVPPPGTAYATVCGGTVWVGFSLRELVSHGFPLGTAAFRSRRQSEMFPRRRCFHLRQFRVLPMNCLRMMWYKYWIFLFRFVSVRLGRGQCPPLRGYVIFIKGLLAETRLHCTVLCAPHSTVLFISFC